MPTFFSVWHLTVVHSYSKKMLESGDNQIKKKGRLTYGCADVFYSIKWPGGCVTIS
jgi:hypothetical protein